jgi:hypothetical protein
MQSDDPCSKKFTAQNINRVLEFEEKRIQKGYAPGWLFYQCNPLDLVEVMEYLREQGLIESHCTKNERVIPAKLLTVELVPETSCFSNIQFEISKDEWEKIKKITFTKAGRNCQICGDYCPNSSLICHENWQYDDTNHIQILDEFIALCPTCQKVKQKEVACIKRLDNFPYQQLARVNRWTIKKTKQYVDEQYQTWKKRSQHEWELDISWLNQLEIYPRLQEPPRTTNPIEICRIIDCIPVKIQKGFCGMCDSNIWDEWVLPYNNPYCCYELRHLCDVELINIKEYKILVNALEEGKI